MDVPLTEASLPLCQIQGFLFPLGVGYLPMVFIAFPVILGVNQLHCLGSVSTLFSAGFNQERALTDGGGYGEWNWELVSLLLLLSLNSVAIARSCQQQFEEQRSWSDSCLQWPKLRLHGFSILEAIIIVFQQCLSRCKHKVSHPRVLTASDSCVLILHPFLFFPFSSGSFISSSNFTTSLQYISCPKYLSWLLPLFFFFQLTATDTYLHGQVH